MSNFGFLLLQVGIVAGSNLEESVGSSIVTTLKRGIQAERRIEINGRSEKENKIAFKMISQ